MTVETLVKAYERGLLPFEHVEDKTLEWYASERRIVLFFKALKIPRRDRQFLRSARAQQFRVTFDRAFEEVIRACSMAHEENWITPSFIEHYIALFRANYAHSVEVWKDTKLVAGLYGVFVNGVFTGESMFHFENDVTKLAFAALIDRLQRNGHTFLDAGSLEMFDHSSSETPSMQRAFSVFLPIKWGASPILYHQHQHLLNQAHRLNLPF